MSFAYILIIVVVSLLGTLGWIAVHIVGLVQYTKRPPTSAKAQNFALAAWIISFVSGFLGPFAILGNMIAFVMGAIAWKNAAKNPGDLIPARTATIAGALLSVMGCLIALVAGAVSLVANA